MTHFLHPEYLKAIPLVGNKIISKLESSYKPSDSTKLGKISVAIRAVNEAKALEGLLQDIQKQVFNGVIDVVVVDNESTDTTAEVARRYGAKVVTLLREDFTYPRSMNIAMDNAESDLVFLTVGHARLLSTHSLQAGYDLFKDKKLAGAYGHALPNHTASRVEKLIAIGSLHYTKQRQKLNTGLGVMAATGAIYHKPTWKLLGTFDETYEIGGEDGAMAAKMLEAGYKIVDGPLLSTHHTHGLGLFNTIKQWRTWNRSGRPTKLDLRKVQKRRPDLDLDT